MAIKPDPRFAHSAGSGGETPNPDDEVDTRDDDTAEHTSTRTTADGVEEQPGDRTPKHGARLEAPPLEVPNRQV